MRKTFAIFLPLIALATAVILSENGYPLGHYGIPGTYIGGCDVCHDFVNGNYAPVSGNLRWVRDEIEWPEGTVHTPVYFRIFEDTDGTLADGNDSKLDGPCEVCHPPYNEVTGEGTKYHNYAGDGTTHYDHQNCLECHPHFSETTVNYFEPSIKGAQSHTTHWTDIKGPQLGETNCTVCHYPSDYKRFGPSGDSLEDTDVCDACHSPNGAFDGVGDLGTCSITFTTVCNEDSDCPEGETCVADPNSVAYGAKYNWEHGIYKPVSEGSPSELKDEKQDWCATCHDDGTSETYAASPPPNVMGDSVDFGYNITGHGKDSIGALCDDCHDLTSLHIDGDSRTYSASANNYRVGYRLDLGLAVPRVGEVHPNAFRLCTTCHTYTDITGPNSNFRDDLKGFQFHDMHLNWWPSFDSCDTDFDGSVDSAISCICCHNVHGSPCLSDGSIVSCLEPVETPMIRHGELMSTPGTTDKVPAMDFHWYLANSVTSTTLLESSRYGALLAGTIPDLSTNHSCYGCHPETTTGEMKWYRTPGGPFGVIIESVWTSDDINTPTDVFARNQIIRYHVRFRIAGSGSYYVNANGRARNINGTDWLHKLWQANTFAEGTYTWTWRRRIPGDATPGSDAKVTISVAMYDVQGGTKLSSAVKLARFSIAP